MSSLVKKRKQQDVLCPNYEQKIHINVRNRTQDSQCNKSNDISVTDAWRTGSLFSLSTKLCIAIMSATVTKNTAKLPILRCFINDIGVYKFNVTLGRLKSIFFHCKCS